MNAHPFRTCIAALLLYLPIAPQTLADLGQPEPLPEKMPGHAPNQPQTAWTFGDNGLRFESADEHIQFRVRARLEGETAFFSSNTLLESQVGALDNDFQFRRARVAFQGSIGRRFQFKMESDYSDSDLSIETVYAGLRRLPHNLRIRAGHIKEPFALEWATSSRNAMFLERSVMSALRPSRNTGVVVYRGSRTGRATFAAGLFRSIRGLENHDVNKKPSRAATVRATALPWVDVDRENRAVHVGVSFSRRDYLNDEIHFRAEPELDLAPNFADSGTFNAAGSTLLGLEFALLAGPWSLQAETVRAAVDSPDAEDPRFDATYLALSWFITGESRPYDRRAGRFVRVHPNRDFLNGQTDRGIGAWEIVLRHSHLDLNDGTIEGGVLRGITLGVNWYLSSRVKILANVAQSEVRGSGSIRMAGMRVQMDF